MAATEPGLAALMSARAAGLVTEAGTDGLEAGTAFVRGFSAADFAALQAPLAAMAPAAAAEAATAGEGAAATFGSRFKSLLSNIPLLGGMIPGVEAEAAAGGRQPASRSWGSSRASSAATCR